jgi:thioredoxin-related protein
MASKFRGPFVVLTTGAMLSLSTFATAHGPRGGGISGGGGGGLGQRQGPLRSSGLIPGLGGRNSQGMSPQQGTFPTQPGTIPGQQGTFPTQSVTPVQPAAPLPPQNLAITPIAAPAPVKAPQLAAKGLSQQMNEFCVSMHKTYGKMKNFGDAYREAYELLQMAKKIDAAIAAGGTPQSISDQLMEFDGEIHHVENHIAEFATIQGPNNKTEQAGVSKSLNAVESALDGMLKKAGIDRSIAPPPPPPLVNKNAEPAVVTVSAVSDPRELVGTTKELTQKTNEFCLEMHKTYSNQPEFNEAYREAFELLQLAKKIESDVSAGADAKSVSGQLSEFDSEMHHVEEHLSDFAKAQGANNKAGQDSVAANFAAVGSTLERAMGQLGLRRKAEDAHNHAEVAALPNGLPFSQQTSVLYDKIGSFCNAMDHNFKMNPDFPEAYREAYAVYEISKKVVDLAKNNEISAECKELLVEIDGEMHHLEEHVDSFKSDDKGTGEGSRRVKRKLSDGEDTLHALMAQVGIKRKHAE